jgi:EAL domain-containing protein (putative c-di-GMP-specific phosphodiesterase class I)
MPDLEAAIRQATAGQGLSMEYQPIFSLGEWVVGAKQAVGFEALARFELPVAPEVWFREAARMGLGVELEMAAVQAAIGCLEQLPADHYLTFNISPAVVESPVFSNTILALPLERMRIEISEEAPISDYEHFRLTLERLRRRGFRVAIDDVGAGLASLKHLVLLPHDIVKLDVDLVRGVDIEPNRQAIVTAVVALTNATGVEVVAEGIETMPELLTLVDLGVRYGQGFHLARPGPLPQQTV